MFSRFARPLARPTVARRYLAAAGGASFIHSLPDLPYGYDVSQLSASTRMNQDMPMTLYFLNCRLSSLTSQKKSWRYTTRSITRRMWMGLMPRRRLTQSPRPPKKKLLSKVLSNSTAVDISTILFSGRIWLLHLRAEVYCPMDHWNRQLRETSVASMPSRRRWTLRVLLSKAVDGAGSDTISNQASLKL